MSLGFTDLYQQMFRAKQENNHKLADQLMREMEDWRKQNYSTPTAETIQNLLPSLSEFTRAAIGKSQTECNSRERSNCINASFNFHDTHIRWTPYTTMEFLERIQSDFQQISSMAPFQVGDLIVIWSRAGGSWDHQSIDVHVINKADADFPYGLVFDHVVVRLTEDLVFHKPDPTLQSHYQIDFLNSVIMPNLNNRGFELTFHRSKSINKEQI